MVSLHAFVIAAALAGSNDLVLLDFGADWCVPCRSMEPTIQQLEHAGYPVRRVNIEANPDLAQRFNIGPIPCFVLVKDGREVRRIVGATSFDQLVHLFQQASPAPPAPDNGLRGQSPDLLPSTRPGPTQPAPPAAPSHGLAPMASHNQPLQAEPPRSAPPVVTPPPSAATTALQDHQLSAAHRLALQATVRLRVTDADGVSKGTGTIIDVHGDEALIVTCGHIFRESQGKGEISVDLFAPGSRGPVSGHLLLYEADQRDFGLVSIRLNTSVTPVRVATTTYHPQEGESIFSVGCNNGDDPTVRASTISAIDRYVGQPNIEIHGHPVNGRSGGGLFTTDGRVIGICNAADMQEDRGIFAALPTIHLALDQIGLRAIYVEPTRVPLTLANNTHPAPSATHTTLPAMQQTPVAAPSPPEMICILRGADGSNHVRIIPNPSADLMQRIMEESRQQALPTPTPPSQPGGQNIARLSNLPSTSNGPIVRGQGF